MGIGAALFLLLAATTVERYGWAQGPLQPQGQNRNGMHVYIWAGLKSHSEGQHDYPPFEASSTDGPPG